MYHGLQCEQNRRLNNFLTRRVVGFELPVDSISSERIQNFRATHTEFAGQEVAQRCPPIGF